MSKTVAIEIELLDRISGGLDRIDKKMDAMRGSTMQARKELDQMKGVSDRLKSSLAKLGVAFSLKELVSNVANVRGQFQQLEVAFNTMLGSAEQAGALMEQLVYTAAITPFGLEDVAQGAKQLLAYGLEADKVNGMLIRLGDIAAGLSVPLNDLVYLYGTTMAQGRLYTQDLNQFTGRGIPMIQELAKQFGVAESKVKELVEEGKVGFPEVQKVIESLTGEGSKFGGLMEAQSKTITGQISNIEDAFQTMLNNIGKQQEGVFNTALSAVSDVIEHYERFGRILAGVALVYGTYRTALMVAAAASGWATAAEALHYNWLLLVEKAQKALNATMLKNPYVLVTTAIAGVIAALVSMKTETELMQEADENYEAQKQKVIDAEDEHRRKMEELAQIAGNEALSTDTRREALNRLEQKYPSIFAKYDTEYEKLKHIKEIKEEIAVLDGKASITKPENELKSVESRIRELERKEATRRSVSMNTSAGAITKEIGGLNAKEEAELKSLRQRQQNLKKQVRSNEVNAYFDDLSGLSSDQLAQQIRQRQNLLARMRMRGTKYGRITYGDELLRGQYSQDELQYQLNKLTSEQNKRNEKKGSSSQWAANAKKNYQKALKEYNDFVANSTNSLGQGEFEKKAKELKDALDAAKKEYDKYKPSTDQDAKSAQTAADKAEREKQKTEREEEQRRQAKEKLGQELVDMQRQNDAEEIDAMQEGLEKKLRQIVNDYQARKNEIDKQEADWKRENNKAGVDVGENGLTEEQTATLDEARKRNEEKRAKEETTARRERLEQETEALNEYLKAYGSMQEQRLAIAQEYDAKIAKAETEGERLTLNAEKSRALSDFDMKNAKREMNWEDLFGDLGSFTRDQLEKIKGQLKEMLSSGALDTQGYKDVVEQIDKVNESILEAEDKQRGFLGVAVSYNTERRKLEMDVADALERQAAATGEMTSLWGSVSLQRMGLGNLLGSYGVNVGEDDIKASNANGILGKVGSKYGTGSKEYARVREELEKLAKSESDYEKGVQKKTKADTEATQKQQKLNKYLGDFAERLKDIMPLLEQISANVGDLPGLLSTLGVSEESGLGKAAQGLADGTNSAMSAMQDYMSGNYVGAAMNGLKAVGSYVQSATNLFAGAGNEAKMEAEIARLSEANEDLASAIDSLKESISDADNTNRESLEEYKKAYEAQTEWQENQQKIIKDRAGEYANSGYGFLGMKGKSSFRHYADANRGAWLDAFNAALRQSGYEGNLTNATDFFNLSPEAMKAIRDYAPKAWTAFFNSGGHKNPKEDVEAYIEAAGKLEDITSALNEKLTGYTWDGFKSSYTDLLKDLTSSTEDFGDNIEEVISNAMLESLVNDEFKDRIKEIYDYLANAASDGDLTQKELEEIRRMNSELSEDMIARREQMLEAGLIKDTSGESQSGKSGGFTAMTQDQGTKLEGMFTSGLQHWSAMDATLTSVAERMSVAEGHLLQIAENTGISASQLKEIKVQVEKIIRDGIKMK